MGKHHFMQSETDALWVNISYPRPRLRNSWFAVSISTV